MVSRGPPLDDAPVEGLIVAAAAWLGVVLVHEYGHVLAGLLVGVPAREMRVSLRWRPHVALRDGTQWVRPGGREYVTVFQRHVQSVTGAFVYVAGGIVTETLAVLAFSVAMRLAGEPWVAKIAALISLAVLLVAAAVETAILRVRGVAVGDISALWGMSRVWTAVVTGTAFALHVLALAVVF